MNEITPNPPSEPGRKGQLAIAAVALLTIPLTIMYAADVTGDNLYIDTYGSIGSNSAFYTSGGALSVGYGNANSGGYSGTIGYGLIAYSDYCLAVGKYNKNTSATELFVIGRGTSSVPANAFEVHDDGTVIVNEPQGDVEMGIFTN